MSPELPMHHSRPSSRIAGRHKASKRASPYDEHGYSSPDEQNFAKSVSSLPMPRSTDSDSDSEEEVLGLVMDRSAASSTVSMEQSERLEALTKVNQELSQRAAESDRLLRRKIEEHENEIENFQVRIEELSSELSASKRDEKDLRNKEVRVTSCVSHRINDYLAWKHDSYINIRSRTC